MSAIQSWFSPAESALAQGRYDTAVELLEYAAKGSRDRRSKAYLNMHLAAVYALRGENGYEGGNLYLNEAKEADARIVHKPLYQALALEFSIYNGERLACVRQGIKAVLESKQPLAMFHIARALLASGATRRAIKVLEGLDDDRLPTHLVWRRWSLLGEGYARRGDFREAVKSYFVSSSVSTGVDRVYEQLSLAEAWLKLGDVAEASAILDMQAEHANPHLRLRQVLLWSLLHHTSNDPNKALSYLLEAYTLARDLGKVSFEIMINLGRNFALLSNEKQATISYQKALSLADKKRKTFVLHEYGVTLLDFGRYQEAQAILWEVVAEESYVNKAQGYADLGYIAMQMGQTPKARLLAGYALKLGATASACLTLGEVALEDFAYDEAVIWLEKAISASHEGESEWVSAQVLLANALVKQGYALPARLLYHINQALRYLHSHHEWVPTLQAYKEKALSLSKEKPLLN